MNLYTYIYYLHIGNDIPFYIGKTNNIMCRYYQHKKQKGKIIFIEEIDKVLTSEWKFWESWYISLFKSWGFKLDNKNNGGGGCITHKVSDEARHRISIGNKIPKPFSIQHKKNHKESYKNWKVTWGDNISKGLKGRRNTWGGGGKSGTSIL